jgi:4-hydroxy-3-methylbut-2-en-1-yl diphosphate reductase
MGGATTGVQHVDLQSMDLPDMALQEVVLAEPRGFCAGVDRAIEIVERALVKHGAPIYVRHEIVHNTYVVADLRAKGAIFIEDLADVPAGATLVFSAHGVPKAVRAEAAQRGFRVFDATCPLVTKVHVEVAKLAKEGYEFIMIGHKGHPEVEGTMGQLNDGIYLVEDVADVQQVRPRGDKLAVVTQTTLSVDDAAEILAEVKRCFPHVREPKQQDICYATQNRQDAVKVLAPQVDVVIVVGSPTSSNSNRLRELAERLGADAYMIDKAEDLQPQWFAGRQRVGLTAGASAPEVLVQQVIVRLRELGAVTIRTLDGVQEQVHFPLPRGLGDRSMQEAAEARAAGAGAAATATEGAASRS